MIFKECQNTGDHCVFGNTFISAKAATAARHQQIGIYIYIKAHIISHIAALITKVTSICELTTSTTTTHIIRKSQQKNIGQQNVIQTRFDYYVWQSRMQYIEYYFTQIILSLLSFCCCSVHIAVVSSHALNIVDDALFFLLVLAFLDKFNLVAMIFFRIFMILVLGLIFSGSLFCTPLKSVLCILISGAAGNRAANQNE